jgi:hypothetical protein
MISGDKPVDFWVNFALLSARETARRRPAYFGASATRHLTCSQSLRRSLSGPPGVTVSPMSVAPLQDDPSGQVDLRARMSDS